MPSSAKIAFDANLKRASYFLDIHEKVKGGSRGAPTLALRELPRGAVVFAVGALDAFMCEISAEVIVARLKKANAPKELREALRKVQQELPTLSLEISMLSSAEERQTRLVGAVTDHFLNNTSHFGAKGAASVAERCDKRANDLWAALGNSGLADPGKQLDHWTDVRHRIVHQGQKPKVTRKEARDFIALAQAVAETLGGYAATS